MSAVVLALSESRYFVQCRECDGWEWPPKGSGTVPFLQADEQRLIHNAETHGIGAP